jgi:hypothetical protein
MGNLQVAPFKVWPRWRSKIHLGSGKLPATKEVPMRGAGKYGTVTLIAVRDADGLEINVGTASDYKTGRAHAELLLRSTSRFRCIFVKDSAGHRIITVTKVKVGDRNLG